MSSQVVKDSDVHGRTDALRVGCQFEPSLTAGCVCTLGGALVVWPEMPEQWWFKLLKLRRTPAPVLFKIYDIRVASSEMNFSIKIELEVGVGSHGSSNNSNFRLVHVCNDIHPWTVASSNPTGGALVV